MTATGGPAFDPAFIEPALSACAMPRRFLVAASGGLDSSVLMHAVASLRGTLACRVRVVHVDHGLHPESARWGEACASLARSLDLACEIRRVEVRAAAGASLEAAAREARYAALAAALEEGEALLTAHHADDQLETVLLALLRGSGVAGLAAMPARAAFGRGQHLRPLLEVPRAALERYAREHGIAFCDDPSNADARFARNYLRAEIVPRLVARWPAAATTAARSAALCAEANVLVDALSALDLTTCEHRGRLNAQALATLSPARARNALRAWIRGAGYAAPSRAKLEHVLSDVVHARRDAQPCVRWSGAEVRRYREWMYLMPPLPAAPAMPLRMETGRPLALGALGTLILEECTGAGLSASALAAAEISVSFRRGGERIRPPGHAHRRELKKLLQENDIVPWMRGAIPLVYAGGRLAAVADLWLESDVAARGGERALCVRWEGHPSLY